MHNPLSSLRKQFLSDLEGAAKRKDVEMLKVKYLGKKGPVQALMIHLSQVPQQERPLLGKEINSLKEEIAALCEKALEAFGQLEGAARLKEEAIDVTLPAQRRYLGRMHPISLMLEECIDIFIELGFSIQDGPHIDTDYYNFEGLNFPQDHPAREMQDTFYLSKEFLLRTHTSNTELHVMQTHQLPLRVIVPGKCFRNETVSSRSHVFFHQIEGLYIDKGVSFSDLLATMNVFFDKLFKKSVTTRFRPSYFPFVEPGLEVDISCTACSGSGCRLCKHTGWLEVVGAGMTHPNVLRNGGIDPEIYSGFAWGFGIERIAMLRYGIKDIRQFSENDQFFLAQFA